MGLHVVDQAIIAGYFLFVVVIGVLVARRTDDAEDLFLAGRSLTWPFIGLSLFASNISSTTIIGLAGAAYTTGIVDSVYEWGTAVPFAVLALVFVPLYVRSRITTIPEFLERRFDRRSRLLFSGLTIVVSIVVDTAGGLYAGALVLQVFFPGLVLWPTCAGLALFAGLYTAFGGLRAVVYTDAAQAVILILGCGLLTFLMFQAAGFDWSAVTATVEAERTREHLSVVRPLDDPALPWPGLMIAVPFLGFWYVATNQYITQRILGARSVNDARWGIMLAGLLKFLPFFIMIVPGVIAIHLFRDAPLETGDQVIPFVINEVLPVGIKGLVLAGLISAIMSSVDSTLNSASTLIVMDFIKTEAREVGPRQAATYGKVATFVLMVIAAVWAPLIANAGGLWSYLQQMFGIFVPPVVILFLLGAFYPRGNGAGAFWTLVAGIAGGVVLFALANFGGLDAMHFTYRVGVMLVVSAALFVGVSQATPPPDRERIAPYLYAPGLVTDSTQGLPWYENYLYQLAGLLVLVALTYWMLW